MLRGDEVYWSHIPHCNSKQILNVLCTSLSRSCYHISGSLGNGRWILSSWHLMRITSAFNGTDSLPLPQTSALAGAGDENQMLRRICGCWQQLRSQICGKSSSRGCLLVLPRQAASFAPGWWGHRIARLAFSIRQLLLNCFSRAVLDRDWDAFRRDCASKLFNFQRGNTF